ncbi:nucleoside hydrolase [Streptomyces ipomoeae]|jgi:inosine-uridine nucleoside N-ribohydrolase|uniref:Inosine-uridine preferring nucleoside hydrolase n=2 Tax=Streptomyces ipomoeae TaxID=103232 RepID=L1L1A7_9ACTN|nr:nucleoside hydrolase [Streptomyces ipomoeae]EKX66687.1 inosine-uridine preferring nucleoside hydrolase [Streptomyces ipomoeae 91-03]MDX2698439.1 nucleoside hydrolase [Streptomyces ipomoeae]MDX2823302.1 nucleoside hydrolase [Streptomyces ipomoeae]MDX2844050.1 nucleoside hydrolase [Streptomyces ipomoeae]MDX2878327.1 nucleoside hydrolase [Streptomyces ipomoeae]
MGESRDDERVSREDIRAEWRAIVESGESLPGSGLAALSARMRATGNWPEDLRSAPVIIDTDIGGDADDALAVAAAARSLPRLALVLTSDETGPAVGYGARARFARFLLDLTGRTDVAVVSGVSLGDTRYFCADGLVPDELPPQSADVVAAVRAVCAAVPGPVQWVGMGPLSNLALVLEAAPELASRLHVTQMGGALNYRDPSRAEHNFRLDVSSVHKVFDAVSKGLLPTPYFVTSEVTFTSAIEITADHPVHRALAAPDAPAWAALLVAHMRQWFERFHPGTIQHDALALSAALQLPFVDFDKMPVALDSIGRTIRSEVGVPVWLSLSARYPAFMRWLSQRLDPAWAPAEEGT